MNHGGVRADLPAGAISYGQAFNVQPFGNLMVTMSLTGAQLEEVLEQQFVAARSRPLLILGVSSGLTYAFDLPDRDAAGLLVPGQTSGDRVTNLALNGVPVDPAATYRVAVNNFLADGGDGFATFKLETNRVGGGDDLVALIDYLSANPGITAPPTDRINGLP